MNAKISSERWVSIIKKKWVGCKLFLFHLLFLLLIACHAEALPASTPETFVPQDFIVQPLPPFIHAVYPPSQSIMPLAKFQGNQDSENGSLVCVRWTATYGYRTENNDYYNEWLVVEPGDVNFDDTVYERTSLKLNDQVVQVELVENLIVETIVTFKDGQVLRVGGPFSFCWRVEPIVGQNFAIFQVRKTSGDIFSYSWYFDLTP